MASARPLKTPILRSGTRGSCPASGVLVAQWPDGMGSVGIPMDDDDPRARLTFYRDDRGLPDSDRPW